MTKELRRIVYVSRANRAFLMDDLLQLLTRARAMNQSLDVCGTLFYRQGMFLQFIEGSDDAIEQVMRRVRADRRHEGILTLVDAIETGERFFPDWKMGFYHLSEIESIMPEGLIENDANDLDLVLSTIDQQSLAGNVLASFWRANRDLFLRQRS